MPAMQEFNAVMQKASKEDPLLTYIDIFTPMLNESGSPLKHIFRKDNLHMNRDGYIIWRDTVRPILVDAEKKYEK
jgi:lysophospholipase L1-like esterase